MKEDAQAKASDPLRSPEKTAQVAAAIDDPCDEGGFDQFCRDRTGKQCRFHEQFCKAPDYTCLDHLRHALAVEFLEQIATRRQANALAATVASNDLTQLTRR